MTNNKEFIKEAYKSLVKRGKITESSLKPSTVTDDMIEEFEEEMDIKIPCLYKEYLKTYSCDLEQLEANVPMDFLIYKDIDVVRQICEMDADEIAALDEDEIPYAEKWDCGILLLPDKNPLSELGNAIKGFRETVDYLDNDDITIDKIKKFLPIGEWQNAGTLCIDTSKKEENVLIDDPSTWQICWFDHEETDWKDAEYIDENGEVIGDILLPDYKAFLKLYYFGVYDKVFGN